ncbi:MAG: RES domain-containing protein [Thermoleophilaceae bacterium]|nr:RES domain-containing protein [Thermoleophilaceae bacterium]
MQYLASTPDGAWAEFLRREEITDPADLDGVERALWAVEVNEEREVLAEPQLADRVLTGGLDSYSACRHEARRLREEGVTALSAPSAAVVAGGARGQRVAGGLTEADDVDGRVLALFGSRPEARGWACCSPGRPQERLLPLVRPLS